MSALLGWINALGWTLLHFVWQGLLVGAIYALLGLVLARQRASVRYAVGLGALALLAALPAATLWYLAPGASQSSGIALAGPIAAVFGDVVAGGENTGALQGWLPALVALWFAGVCVLSVRYIAQYRHLSWLCREASAPLLEWNTRLQQLCRHYGIARAVRLVQSAAVQTPCLIGWIAPVIVLPASTLVGLTPAQIELVIAHELGHIRRWDYLVNALQIALETVLFYHPVVHWISRHVRNDREACCDDLVLELGADPVVYARALANLEELRDSPLPAVAASGGFLLGRIRRIVGLEPALAVPRTVPLVVLVLMLAAAALISQRNLPKPAPRLSLETPVAMLRTLHAPPLAAAPAAAPSVVPVAPARLVEAPAVATPDLATAAIEPESAPVALKPERIALASALPARPQPLAAKVGNLSPLDRPALELALAAPANSAIAKTRVAPTFPQRARIAGIEGRVSLSFVVDASGQAREIRVLEATPQGEFEAAATAALREWRFNHSAVSPGQRYSQVFDFSLADQARAETEADCRYAMGSHICRHDLPAVDVEGAVTETVPAGAR